MARLVTSGAEIEAGSTNVGPDGLSSSSTRDTSVFRSGAASFLFSSTGANVWSQTLTSGATYYARVYVRTGSTPSAASVIMALTQFGGLQVDPTVRIKTDGTIELLVNSAVSGSASASAINDSTWHRVELMGALTTTNWSSAELRLDGATVATWSGSVANSGAFGLSIEIEPGSSVTMNADDIALNSNAGGSQNTWPGSGKVVLLKPISDNARGTGWVNDANAASGFFDATDNTPPNGIADTTSSTGLHQIRNGTSNANSSVDLNLTSYTTAGIVAADTINVLDPIANTAAPVSTSAKQGTLGVASNPAIANISLAASPGTSGAFWGGTAAGTYGSGWGKWSHGTITYAPSVTLGTSPVIRVTQVTSSTRIAMVDFLGMYVDYTPAVVTTFVPRSPGVDSGNAHF